VQVAEEQEFQPQQTMLLLLSAAKPQFKASRNLSGKRVSVTYEAPLTSNSSDLAPVMRLTYTDLYAIDLQWPMRRGYS
jgi:hypothetical protein